LVVGYMWSVSVCPLWQSITSKGVHCAECVLRVRNVLDKGILLTIYTQPRQA
jgi:hypothetical protein